MMYIKFKTNKDAVRILNPYLGKGSIKIINPRKFGVPNSIGKEILKNNKNKTEVTKR